MAFTARRRQPATVRVASLDVQHSHRRSAVVLGPVTMPSLDELRAKLLGTIQAPASKLVRTLVEPGSSLARVVRAKFAEE